MDDTISILNHLIETSEDGKKGFAEAAQKATDVKLKQLFNDRSSACAQSAGELKSLVVSLGGKPEQGGSVKGAMHRGWVAAKAAVEDSNVAVLEEVERGEDYAKAAFGKALKAPLPADVKLIVEKQYQGVVANHDRIRDLRNHYKRAA